jgi:hypothetical protein
MAGDWIKVQICTPDKPEVHQMAEMLEIDPDAVTGKLLRIWIWADQQTIDGNAGTVTKSLLDRITAVSGFAESMLQVGWLERTDDGFCFPNFSRHNGTTAKTRASSAKRVEKHRKNAVLPDHECNAESVTGPLTTALPEKRREEKRKKKTQSDRFTESDEQTAQHIWQLIQQAFPNQRKPNLKTWADTIRKMRELDKLEDSQIRSVFEWANSDDFWRPNILSPTKLRDKWNTLAARAMEKKPARKILPGTPEWAARSIQWLDKVPEWQAMANRGEITDQEFNRRVNEARMNADKDME